MSQPQKYTPNPSHVTQLDDMQVRENLIVQASTLRIEDRKAKHLRGKEIALVKVVKGGHGGSVTWEIESRMRESYPELFLSGNFRGRRFFKWGRVVTPQFRLFYFN